MCLCVLLAGQKCACCGKPIGEVKVGRFKMSSENKPEFICQGCCE